MKKYMFAALMISTVMGCSSSKLSVSDPLFKNKWVLSELNGTPVQMSNTNKDAHLVFSFDGMAVRGSGGCNNLTGTFTAKGDDLSFGPMASTRMLCPDSQFETAFLAVLGKVNHYYISDNILQLKDDKTIVARFMAK